VEIRQNINEVVESALQVSILAAVELGLAICQGYFKMTPRSNRHSMQS